MALTEDANGTENFRLESPSGRVRDRADPLTYFWSVTLPHWLDPWAPRVADAFADGAWTAAWRGLSALVPFLGFIIGLLVPQVWPGMHSVYTESLLFMALIIGGAILSGPVGLMMLLGHVIATLVWDSTGVPPRTRNQEWLDYFVRRHGSALISYLLLAIPALMMSQQARWMAEETVLPLKINNAARAGIQVILYALGCGLLIYLWSQAMAVLIRPVFTWLGMAPRAEAIVSLQQNWQWLVGVAVMSASARLPLERMGHSDLSRTAAVAALRQQRWASPERRDQFWRSIPAPARIILRSAVITLVLAGFYQHWTDALLVAVATIFFEAWRAGWIARFPQWWDGAVLKVPALLRFATALVGGYLLSQWIIARQWRGDTFRPILWASVLSVLIFYLFFPQRTDLDESATEKKDSE